MDGTTNVKARAFLEMFKRSTEGAMKRPVHLLAFFAAIERTVTTRTSLAGPRADCALFLVGCFGHVWRELDGREVLDRYEIYDWRWNLFCDEILEWEARILEWEVRLFL